jgi:hypothetical protein
MKPEYVSYDASFEKKLKRYKSRLTKAEKDRIKKKLGIFKGRHF